MMYDKWLKFKDENLRLLHDLAGAELGAWCGLGGSSGAERVG